MFFGRILRYPCLAPTTPIAIQKEALARIANAVMSPSTSSFSDISPSFKTNADPSAITALVPLYISIPIIPNLAIFSLVKAITFELEFSGEGFLCSRGSITFVF